MPGPISKNAARFELPVDAASFQHWKNTPVACAAVAADRACVSRKISVFAARIVGRLQENFFPCMLVPFGSNGLGAGIGPDANACVRD
jgi:hypothetical protein